MNRILSRTAISARSRDLRSRRRPAAAEADRHLPYLRLLGAILERPVEDVLPALNPRAGRRAK